MASYVLRRIFMLIPVLLGVSILVFLIVHLSPGDPARLMLGERAPVEQLEALREQLGLNDPLPIQYVKWLGRVVKLDFGRSIRSNRPVVEEIAARTSGHRGTGRCGDGSRHPHRRAGGDLVGRPAQLDL